MKYFGQKNCLYTTLKKQQSIKKILQKYVYFREFSMFVYGNTLKQLILFILWHLPKAFIDLQFSPTPDAPVGIRPRKRVQVWFLFLK